MIIQFPPFGSSTSFGWRFKFLRCESLSMSFPWFKNVGESNESSSTTWVENTLHSDSVCSICLDSMNEEVGEDIYIVPGCCHTFHKPCITRWMIRSRKCPYCRGPLPKYIGLRLSFMEILLSDEAALHTENGNVLENAILNSRIKWLIHLNRIFSFLENVFFGMFIVISSFAAMYNLYKEDFHHTYYCMYLMIITSSLYTISKIFT